jgi:predicted RNase H-like nuclease
MKNIGGRSATRDRFSTGDTTGSSIYVLAIGNQDHLAELDRAQIAEHDLLDAAVAAWTAECVSGGVVPRQFDSRGLRMEIVY